MKRKISILFIVVIVLSFGLMVVPKSFALFNTDDYIGKVLVFMKELYYV